MNEMRDSFIELMFAKECLNQYEDLSLSDMFFEETDEIKETNKNNDNLLKKATDAVGSAIKKLIDMIKTCIDKVKEFISTRFMSKEQRIKYKKLKKAVMSNPSLANTPVNIVSTATYNAIYDEEINKLNKLEKSGNLTEEAANGIVSEVSQKISDAKNRAKSVATRTTLKGALQIAEKDVLVAHELNKALNSELISLEDLVGENEANKYKKQVSHSTSKAIFHRVKSGLLRKKQETVLDCLKLQTRTLLNNFTDIGKSDEEREYITKSGKVKKRVISTDSLLHGVGRYKDDINEISGKGDTADKIASNIARRSKTNDYKKSMKHYKRSSNKIFKR